VTQQAVLRVEKIGFLLVGVATLVSLLFQDRAMVLGVGLGSALAALNFSALRRILQGIFTGKNPRKQLFLGILLTIKFALLATAIYLIIKFIPISAIAFIIGISVVVMAIFVEGFRIAFCEPTHQRNEEVNENGRT
jgi:hypothetical protein